MLSAPASSTLAAPPTAALVPAIPSAAAAEDNAAGDNAANPFGGFGPLGLLTSGRSSSRSNGQISPTASSSSTALAAVASAQPAAVPGLSRQRSRVRPKGENELTALLV